MRLARLWLPDFLNLAIVDSSRLKSRLVLPTTEFETCILSTSHVAGPNQQLLRLISNSGSQPTLPTNALPGPNMVSSLSPVSTCTEFTLTFGSLHTEEQ